MSRFQRSFGHESTSYRQPHKFTFNTNDKMGNVGGVVQWLSTSSSSEGLQKWEEQAIAGLTSNNKLIDAARLVAAWPHLRSSFLSYVQSGRWLQSYYVSERKQLVAFLVHLQPLALSPATSGISILEDGSIALSHRSDKSKNSLSTASLCNPVKPSMLLPFDSVLRHDSHSYALLLAAVFSLYLDHLQSNGSSQFWSHSSSMPGSPSQTLTQPLSAAVNQQTKLLESFGGNNPQENALRQYFVENFFIGSEILGLSNSNESEKSIYSRNIQGSPSSPTPSDKSPEETNIITSQQDLWHLDETLVSAMAQLDFMSLDQRLKQQSHHRKEHLGWIKDILFQLESLSLGIAVLNVSTGCKVGSNVFLDDLRIRYCNSAFGSQTAMLLPYLVPLSANPSITNFSLNSSSKRNKSDKNISSFSARVSGRWSGRSSFAENSSARNSIVNMNNDANNGSTLIRFSQRLGNRLNLSGRIRQSQLMTGDKQKHAVRIHALHKIFAHLPSTHPALDTLKNEAKSNDHENADNISQTATSCVASRASSCHSLALSSVSELDKVPHGDVSSSQNFFAVHVNEDMEKWVLAVQELHQALRYRQTATILSPGLIDYRGKHSSFLWIVRPVFNKMSSINEVSHMMVLQISVPSHSIVKLIPERENSVAKSFNAKNIYYNDEINQHMSLKSSEMIKLSSQHEEEEEENDENFNSVNIQPKNKNKVNSDNLTHNISNSRKKYSVLSESSVCDVDHQPFLMSTSHYKLKRMICSSDEQLLQQVKLAEDICNILPPLLLL